MSLLTVEIEALVLDGFDLSPGEGRRLARLTEAALARLLDQRGTASRMAAGGAKEAPEQKMEVAPGARPERMAEQIAEVLYRALDRGY